MIVASDLMGALTTGSPFLGLVDWVKHNQSKFRANLYMAAITPSYLLAKNGVIDWQTWGQKLITISSKTQKGIKIPPRGGINLYFFNLAFASATCLFDTRGEHTALLSSRAGPR
jgi:hypothetical protein